MWGGRVSDLETLRFELGKTDAQQAAYASIKSIENTCNIDWIDMRFVLSLFGHAGTTRVKLA